MLTQYISEELCQMLAASLKLNQELTLNLLLKEATYELSKNWDGASDPQKILYHPVSFNILPVSDVSG